MRRLQNTTTTRYLHLFLKLLTGVLNNCSRTHMAERISFQLVYPLYYTNIRQNKNLKKNVFMVYSTFFQTMTQSITRGRRFCFLIHSRELRGSTQFTQYHVYGNPGQSPALQLSSFVSLDFSFCLYKVRSMIYIISKVSSSFLMGF